ncbi:hypothetical protein [Caulobacter sp. B11]|uniref:hypothetical protein n=1 Tax=Caulobacter sp. B11 TaxID=2048899 RepID=UPI001F27A85D|nr:hypothetical protein [Caulobacter sp. B11]
MYTSEFPVESQVPTFEPTLLVGIVLVVLAVAVLAFYLGKLAGKKDERWREVPKTIHEAVKAKCVAATSAPSGELLLKAQELVEEIKGRVGPVMAFGGPAAKALKGIEEAIKGEPPADDKAKEKDKPKPKGEHGKADDKHGQGLVMTSMAPILPADMNLTALAAHRISRSSADTMCWSRRTNRRLSRRITRRKSAPSRRSSSITRSISARSAWPWSTSRTSGAGAIASSICRNARRP